MSLGKKKKNKKEKKKQAHKKRDKRTDSRQKWSCSFPVHVKKKAANLQRAAQQTETHLFEQ